MHVVCKYMNLSKFIHVSLTAQKSKIQFTRHHDPKCRTFIEKCIFINEFYQNIIFIYNNKKQFVLLESFKYKVTSWKTSKKALIFM